MSQIDVARPLDVATDRLALTSEGEGTPGYARHETFHPRFGWLKKGFDAIVEEPELFATDDAPLRLGVGKNMARSIRFWCNAFKLVDEHPIASGRRRAARPTRFGTKLLAADGWDPFLEDPASLWLLHWKLLQAPVLAPAWDYAFNSFAAQEFVVEELSSSMEAHARRAFPTLRAASSAFRKDASCIIRMYTESGHAGIVSEETLASPFSELGLLRAGISERSFSFVVGPKPNLPSQMLVAACVEFAASVSAARTLPISRLLNAAKSPGLAFKLSETALYEALEEVGDSTRSIGVSASGGLVQMYYEGDPADRVNELLASYYTRRLWSA